MNWKVCSVVCLGLALALPTWAGENGGLILEAADAITAGNFNYQDAEVNIDAEFFNPQGSAEYYFPGGAFALGILYAQSENGYDLDFDDGDTRWDGSLDVERTTILPFVRLGKRESINLRLGLNMFDYEFTDGILDKTEDGVTTHIRNGYAKGDLSTGIDAELSLLFGEQFQFGLILGGTYFIGAEYEWTYLNADTGQWDSGTAELDAVTVRLAPELSFEVADGWRLFARYQIAGTTWLGSKDDEDEEYAGVDVFAAAIVGLRVDLGF